MKRIVPLLLTVLLLTVCMAAVPAKPVLGDGSPVPSPAPGSVRAPFLTYSFYDQPHWEYLTEAVMFEADLDQDGAAEPVSFSLDRDGWRTAISWGESTILLEEGDDFMGAAVLDLDPASPVYNLLAVLDYGSDSYVTVELHPEEGRLVRGRTVQGSWEWSDGALWFFERTDFLGTAQGRRTYSGDDLTHDSEWLVMGYIPTAEALPDGGTAFIACTRGEHGWPYLIDGLDMQDYFDNLFLAD